MREVNPPKNYQDIYPLNFDNDPEHLPKAYATSSSCGSKHGVARSSASTAHTKPIPFWERLLMSIRRSIGALPGRGLHAAMMRTLGAIGFDQSYTYFAWRTEKEEIEEYLR